MDTIHVKICGLTNLEDALTAIEAGADLLGFNFYPGSSRYLEPPNCAQLVARLREAIPGWEGMFLTVGVFVNHSPEDIRAILDECDLDLAQLSGDEPPEDLASLGGRAFKAFRPDSPAVLQTLVTRYPGRSTAPAWLVDAHRAGQFGGTGYTADWGLARQLASQAPVLLAGGLTPENVSTAIQQVKPWGVDVASGVESAPGVKDPQKIVAFVRAARSSI